MTGEKLLEMRNITKRFGSVVANDRCRLEVRRGEIHALLGENGAGKTTLMNILYGLHQPDAGEMIYQGRPVRVGSPDQAIALGIGMVHQHFMLVPPFTVAENVVLGREPRRRGGRLDMARAVARVRELIQEHGLEVDPEAKVESISVGMQQRVEILKALYRGAELLILDEPTAVLTPQEVAELAAILRALVAQGRTVIFITHKLKEVLRIADRVTVIRRGRPVATLPVSAAARAAAAGPGQAVPPPPSEPELARLMVGREVTLRVEKPAAAPGAPVLEVAGLQALNNRGLPALRGISLTVRAGEILAIAGVDGNGQTELAECLAGLRVPTAGQIRVGGREVTRAPVSARRQAGLGHIPEDRQRRGLVLDFSVAENAVLGAHALPPCATHGMLRYPAIYRVSDQLIAEHDVRTPGLHLPARSLSGGNQQKLIAGREIGRQPAVLVAAQPTRGMDVGAIEFIHRRLVSQRDRGMAVLLISLELDEILSLADRIAVIYEGRLVAELPAGAATEEELGLLMAGGGSSGGGAG